MPLDRFRCLAGATATLLLLGFACLAHAQTQAQAPPAPAPAPAADAPQSFKSSATAVLVDVVVRDSKGAPVLDLTPADFELYEDEVRQPIGSVSLVAPGRPAGGESRTNAASPPPAAGRGSGAPVATSPAAAAGTTDGASRPTVLALVFHRLSPEGRALSHQAALAYVNTPARADDYAGVFQIDQSLNTIQTYTNDREKVRKAVDTVATRPSSVDARGSTSPFGSAGGDRDPNVSPTQGAESSGSPDLGLVPRTNDADPAMRALRQMSERMEEQYQIMARDRQGQTTMNALLALVNSMALLPGRKSIVFFAEGLSIPADVQVRFQELVGAANRANVSIYTMDGAGLRVQSEQAATSRSLTRLGFAGVGDILEGDVDSSSNGAMTTRLERNEFILRQDPKAALGLLAKETGGFLIDNTNNLANAFGRIDSDRRFHYLLTYAPTNTTLDGSYRHISVKVHRPQVEVRARGGYYAVPAPGTILTRPFETAALAALETHPRPTMIPMRAEAFQFPDLAHPGRLALVVSLPESEVGHMVNGARTAYRTDFTVLARLTDAQGVVVRQGSQPYQLAGPADQVERARQREVLFYRQPTLLPGRYTLEYVVHDALTGHAGTGSAPIAIEPASATTPAVSSLIIVRRAEEVPAGDRDDKNPLYCGDLLLYPNLGEPLRKTVDRALTFFYTVYPRSRGAALTAALSATLVLESNGRVLANLPLTLPAPDTSGRIQHLARLPLDDVPAGAYDLHITIADGTTQVTRTAMFTLRP